MVRRSQPTEESEDDDESEADDAGGDTSGTTADASGGGAEPASERSGLGDFALSMFLSWLESNASAAVDYGGSAAVVGAQKLGWTFEEFTEQMKRFWEQESTRKF